METKKSKEVYLRVGTGDWDTLPNSKPGYTINFFRDLGELPNKLHIKDGLIALLKNEQEPLSPEDEVPEDPEKFKYEMYMLTAFSIEEVWGYIKHFREENSEALEYISDPEKYIVKQFTDVESKLLFENSEDLSDMFYLIKRHTHLYIIDAGESWSITQEKINEQIVIEDPFQKQSNKVFKRLGRLIAEGRHTTTSARDNEPSESIEQHVLSGMNTGEQVILDMQQVLIETFEKQFNRPITQTEFDEISVSVRSLVVQIASVSNYVFPVIMNVLREHGRHDAYNPFKRDAFKITQGDRKLVLEIKPEFLSRILEGVGNIKIPAGTIKCPALLAPGQEKKNVISEMYDWYEMLTKKYILPNVGRVFKQE